MILSVGLTDLLNMRTKAKQSRKNQNKEKVVSAALDFFSKYGIENSKVSDIALQAGVTERSAFRYFKTKNELILAAALYFWNNAVYKINELMNESVNQSLSGIDKVGFILKQYAKLYDSSKKELIFCAEAETYLKRSEKLILLGNTPPIAFSKSNDPLACAIKEGIQDKSIQDKEDIDLIYLNTYDSLLGFMQKLALREELADDADSKKRLDLFIVSLIKMYR